MRIPVNDLKRRHAPIAEILAEAVDRVLRSGWYIQGREVAAFEEEFAAYCGARHCIGVGNGTDAIELALRAIGAKGEVATVANAGMYSTTAILNAGALPVYVDVDPATMNMNPAALETASAIIVTHLYGRIAPIENYERRIPIIEDCAQAHGIKLIGNRVGCFSFYPTKNLGALGDGGAVVTSDDALAARIRGLAQYGWTSRYQSTIPGGRNSRLDEMQAAILRAQLPYLDGWNARRRAIAAHYNLYAGPDTMAHLCVIRSPDRDRLRRALADKGIATDIHYPIPDHLQESMRAVPFRRTNLPVTEACAREVLTIPCFPEMTDDEVREVSAAISENEHLVSISAR
jgi:dTDP-4-amino-4,6-dideoxygalactose transaminase